MVGYQISLIVISSILALCGLIGIVYSFVIYRQKQKVPASVMLIISLMAIVLFCMTFPTGIEEYTQTAVIQGVGNSFVKYNAAYVEIDGKTEEISVGEYNRNMFDVLAGQTVELTYGKIHTIFGIGENWKFVDLKIVEN